MRDKLGRFKKGYRAPREWIEKNREWHKGRKPSKETRRKISKTESITRKRLFKEGKLIHPKGMLGKHHTEKTKRKISLSHLGKKLTEEQKRKIGEKSKLSWKNPEYRRKILRRRIPSCLEKKFIKIIRKLNLPYKYVGNGQFWIETFNPDFIECNGKKIAIEVFCNFFKLKHYKNIEDYKNKRTQVFNKYGWKIIFFDETEIKEDSVFNKLNFYATS